MKPRLFSAKRTHGATGTSRASTLIALVAGAALMGYWSATTSSAASSADTASDIVATVNDHKITEQDVEARAKPQLEAEQDRIYDIKRKAAEALRDEYLIEQEAKKANLSIENFKKKEFQVVAVTEAEAKKWYDQNKDHLRGKPTYDQIKPQLVEALNTERQRQREQELLDRLRAAASFKVLLTPVRSEVASAGHPTAGLASAPVKIVEFGDFQCPYCKKSEDTLKQVRAKYPDQVSLVYMDYPLPFHAHALQAAEAGRCAEEQGKFWEYHDQLYADQSKLAPADLKAAAKKLGLDTAKFDGCLDKAKYDAAIHADMAEGQRLGVEGTPTFYIDGRALRGSMPLKEFEDVINEELAAKGGLANAAH